jgi:hypothetical protein
MTTPRAFDVSSRLTSCGAALLALTLIAMAGTVSGQQPKADASAAAARQRFLEMFARAYFPGRTGQLLIVPREVFQTFFC